MCLRLAPGPLCPAFCVGDDLRPMYRALCIVSDMSCSLCQLCFVSRVSCLVSYLVIYRDMIRLLFYVCCIFCQLLAVSFGVCVAVACVSCLCLIVSSVFVSCKMPGCAFRLCTLQDVWLGLALHAIPRRRP